MKLKAYGKILVYGGYSLLEEFNGRGGIGLVLNVNKGTSAVVKKLDYNDCIIEIPRKGIYVKGKIEDNELKIERHRYLKFVISAIRTSLYFKKIEGGLHLILENDKELGYYKVKTGIGSSATSTVVTIASVLSATGLNSLNNKDLIFKLANKSHRKVQKNIGSGFDISSAIFGSQLYRKPKNEEELQSNIVLKSDFIPDYLKTFLAFSGKSAFTVNLVKNVGRFKRNDEQYYNDFMNRYNSINEELSEIIKILPKNYEQNKVSGFIDLLEKSWNLRKELGEISNTPIETDEHTEMLKKIKDQGALTTGFTGAGGGDSIFVISRDNESKMKLIKYLEDNNFYVFKDLKIGNFPLEIID